MYQAEPHQVSTATGFSWQAEDGHADWSGDLAGNGAGKDETGSGGLRSEEKQQLTDNKRVQERSTKNKKSSQPSFKLCQLRGINPSRKMRTERGEPRRRRIYTRGSLNWSLASHLRIKYLYFVQHRSTLIRFLAGLASNFNISQTSKYSRYVHTLIDGSKCNNYQSILDFKGDLVFP